MVRSYLLGNMLNMVDGPFAISDAIKTLTLEHLSLNRFDLMVKRIKRIDAEELRTLAIKYLNKKDLWEVIVG